jgi:hypothetical protein
MGRPRKYFTAAEHAAAAQARRDRYNQSDLYVHSLLLIYTVINCCHSGKAMRSLQNQAAYRRRHGRRRLSSTKEAGSPAVFPQLPAALISLALLPLPNTYLFLEAYKSADNLDESDLGQWDLDPPYDLLRVPEDTPSEERFTVNLVDVMHGRRLRQEEEEKDRWNNQRGPNVRENILQEIGPALERWQSLARYLKTYQATSREVRMAEHLLQWRARKIHWLYKELIRHS